jgi:hypothetical protein
LSNNEDNLQEQEQQQQNNNNNNNTDAVQNFLLIYQNIQDPGKQQQFRQAAMRLSKDHPQAFVKIFSSVEAFLETVEQLPQLEKKLAELEKEQQQETHK